MRRAGVVLRVGPVSTVVRPRLLGAAIGVGALAFLLFCVGMTVGDYPLSTGDVVAALFSQGDYYDRVVVYDWRMPRALVGLFVGIAFGMAGALFQTATRNPLATPDIIGVSAGATTAVVLGVVLGFGAGLGTQSLGMLGALVAAALVQVLALHRGSTGYRILLVGVGVSWACTSTTTYLLARADLRQAQQVVGWMVGNLNDSTWAEATPLLLACLVLVPATLALTGWVRAMHLGDDVATGLGTPVARARAALLLAGVLLVAVGTAAAGPVAFVALAAPQIATRVARTPMPPLLTSGLTGGAVVLGSDLLARLLLPDTQLPVGIVTGVLGAPFLLWLLARANRTGTGG
ncbi:iron ABC transporter permease [Actinokineospora bangkokensis]|uniref:Iron ABC transporter permease n=1 Tax=Actinokineospora bangkokensis TaxID=1193682 RepID=A0A1Q9LM53_9PSEU|nr:iron ABC transporter permease [Actinokineospora bangkokensis]